MLSWIVRAKIGGDGYVVAKWRGSRRTAGSAKLLTDTVPSRLFACDPGVCGTGNRDERGRSGIRATSRVRDLRVKRAVLSIRSYDVRLVDDEPANHTSTRAIQTDAV